MNPKGLLYNWRTLAYKLRLQQSAEKPRREIIEQFLGPTVNKADIDEIENTFNEWDKKWLS